MGTRFEAVFAGMTEEACDLVFGEIRNELERIEDMLSVFRPGSLVSLLNRKAHAGPVQLDREQEALFSELLRYHRDTGGYFDVAMKPVTDHLRENGGAPGSGFDDVCSVAGMGHLVLEGSSLQFDTAGVALDLGGYGKGYGMRRVVPILEQHEVDHALLSFGESLILGWGTHPYGDCWRISVPGPGRSGLFPVELRGEAVSSSGNSLNNEKKFANSGHIVNPVTLRMCRDSGQVSVRSADPVRCEIYSTALFSAGKDRETEVTRTAPDLQVFWSVPG